MKTFMKLTLLQYCKYNIFYRLYETSPLIACTHQY